MRRKRSRNSGLIAVSGTIERNSSFGPMPDATARARISSPLSRTTPDTHPLVIRSVAHARLRADFCTSRPRRCRDRVGYRAHAADRVTPHARLAVDLAEAVVKQHVRGAGRVRRGVGADDAVERERRLDDLALEPLVEKIGGALGEKIGDEAPALDIEAAQPPREPRALDQFGDAAADIGWRAQHEIAQHVRCLLQSRVVGRQSLGVACRELRDGAAAGWRGRRA